MTDPWNNMLQCHINQWQLSFLPINKHTLHPGGMDEGMESYTMPAHSLWAQREPTAWGHRGRFPSLFSECSELLMEQRGQDRGRQEQWPWASDFYHTKYSVTCKEQHLP
jgi:hypothetical protein